MGIELPNNRLDRPGGRPVCGYDGHNGSGRAVRIAEDRRENDERVHAGRTAR